MLVAVIAMAIIINIIMVGLSSVIIPVILDTLKLDKLKLDSDSALSGYVTLTTVTDIAGFVALLGLSNFISSLAYNEFGRKKYNMTWETV